MFRLSLQTLWLTGLWGVLACSAGETANGGGDPDAPANGGGGGMDVGVGDGDGDKVDGTGGATTPVGVGGYDTSDRGGSDPESGGTGSGGKPTPPPPPCGNGELDDLEKCDDGNHNNTDDCTDSCETPVCGDGFVQGEEICDDGDGTWVHLGASTGICGVRSGGRVECWGNSAHQNGLLRGAFSEVAEHQHFVCGLRLNGTLACDQPEKDSESVRWAKPLVAAPAGVFEHIYSSTYQTCALDALGAATCWGFMERAYDRNPPGTFTKLTLGYNYLCGLRPSGAIACVGKNTDGVASPPTGKFIDVAAGGSEEQPFTCGIRTNGNLECWGSGLHSALPTGKFTKLDAGDGYACALREDGTPACWASQEYAEDMVAPPNEPFVEIEAGRFEACALRANGSISCWSLWLGEPAEPCAAMCGLSGGGSGGLGSGGSNSGVSNSGGSNSGGSNSGGSNSGGSGSGGEPGTTLIGGCNNGPGSYCTTYYGSTSYAGQLQSSCELTALTWGPSCSNANRVATCTVEDIGSPPVKQVTNYYAGVPASINELRSGCEVGLAGVFAEF